MKKYYLFFISFFLAMVQGWATECKIETNPTHLHFATAVEQKTTQIAQFTFFGEIIVIDDETAKSSSENPNTSQTSASNISNHDFSVSIEGPDSRMFAANITEVNLSIISKKIVTVQICYLPMTEGPHQAILKVIQNNEAFKSISLTGETSDEYRDELSTHTNGLFDSFINGFKEADGKAISSNQESFNRPINKFSTPGRIISTAYEIFTWCHRTLKKTEKMDFTFSRSSTEAILGVDTVFYLTAMNGNIDNPITIELLGTEDSHFFDFEKVIITPEEVSSPTNCPTDWMKSMRIGFHPTMPGRYIAWFRITGGAKSNVSKDIQLICDVIEQHNQHSIHISPTTIYHFPVQPVNKATTMQFIVNAKGLEKPLQLKLEDSSYEYAGGSKMYSIVESTTITPNEAALGALVTVKYNPTDAGMHDAVLTIIGDGLSEKILLCGEAINSRISVSESTLVFDNAPFYSTSTQTFTVTGTDLTSNYLNIELNDESGMFSIYNPHPEYNYITLDKETHEAIVMVMYKPTELGAHNAYITISGGGAESKTVHLIGTSGCPSISVSPTSIDFGTVVNGHTSTETINVTGVNLTGDLTVSSTNHVFKVSPKTITKEQAQSVNGATITVTYEPDSVCKNGGYIYFRGGGADQKIITLSGVCTQPVITVNPSSLTFNGTQTKTFNVTGTDLTGPMSLTLSQTGAHGYFQINPTSLPANGGTVTVSCTVLEAGSFSGQVTISGGDADTKTVSLSGSTAPIITVNPTSYDFGKVVKNKSSNPKTFTVSSNLSGTPSLSKSGDTGMFSVVNSLASNGTFSVTYKPTAVGEHSMTITISGGGISKTVKVHGNCIQPVITVNPSSLTFNGTQAKTFMVTGTDLTGPMSLTLSQTGAHGYFQINPTSLPANGGTVTVSCTVLEAGSFSGQVTISGGDADTKTVSLSSSTAPVITVNPTSYDFGKVVKNKSSNPKTFTVSSNLSGTPSLSKSGDTGMFSVVNSLASNGTFIVTYKPTAEGEHSMTITISGGGVSKTVKVYGTCIQPVITVKPSSLTFDGTQTKTFNVTGTDLTGPMSLTLSQTGAHGYFQINPTSLPANGGTVTVTCTVLEAGSFSGQVTISGGDAESKTVSLSGSTAPVITVNPMSYDFGKVVKNKSSNPKTFTVSSNLSGTPSLSKSGDTGMFSVVNSLASNGTFIVTYKPTAEGEHSMTITISGGGVSKSKTVKVYGKCVVPTIKPSTSSLSFASRSSQTFTVSGSNLTGNLTLVSNNAVFTVSPQSITPSQALAGVTVIVSCNAAINLSSASGKITISGGDASPKNVYLTYEAGGNEPKAGLVEPYGENNEGNEKFNNCGKLDSYENSTSDVDESSICVKIYAEELNIIIESPVKQVASIYHISGLSRNVNLQAGRNEIPTNAAGIYIVRIKEKTAKLILK